MAEKVRADLNIAGLLGSEEIVAYRGLVGCAENHTPLCSPGGSTAWRVSRSALS
jgi:hypothetical protein